MITQARNDTNAFSGLASALWCMVFLRDQLTSAPRVGARKAEKLSEIGVMKFNAKLPFKGVEFGVSEGQSLPIP